MKARVISANVIGRDAYQRDITLRWLLKSNTHIKEISENFARGNHWCIITFNCKRGYNEAIRELSNKKEEHEHLKLNLEDSLDIEISINQTQEQQLKIAIMKDVRTEKKLRK